MKLSVSHDPKSGLKPIIIVIIIIPCFWIRMEYFDDLASGQSADQPSLSGLPAIAVKNLHLTGVKAYCDEFPAAHRTTFQSHLLSNESVSDLTPLYS